MNYNLKSWLAKFKALPKEKLTSFSNDIYLNNPLINEIFNVLCDPRHQNFEPVCHQLYEFYRSPERKLKLFCLQFIPTIVYIYLKEHSRLKGFDPDVFVKLESFLLSLYNLSISENFLIGEEDNNLLGNYELFYPINYPSIYHDPQFYQLNTLTEHSKIFADLNTDHNTFFYNQITGSPLQSSFFPASEYLTFKQIIATELILTINSENRFRLLSGLIYVYNTILVELPIHSLKLSCLVIIDLCVSSFQEHFDALYTIKNPPSSTLSDNKPDTNTIYYTRASHKFRRSILGHESFCRYMESHSHETKPANRILADPNLYSQFLRTIYFSLYNGASDMGLEALEAINLRASYHLFPKILLMISSIKNSILPPLSPRSATSPKTKDGRANYQEDYDNDRLPPLQIQFDQMGAQPLALYLSSIPMTLASKTAITNASFKLKKLPEDISPLLPPSSAGHHKNLETVKEEDSSGPLHGESFFVPSQYSAEKDKKGKTQGISSDHHSVNALTSFLPQGAAKFWAKTFNLESSSISGPEKFLAKNAGPIESPGTVPAGAISTKRPSVKNNLSGYPTPGGYVTDYYAHAPEEAGNVENSQYPSEGASKSKKNILVQVKSKLKELQTNQDKDFVVPQITLKENNLASLTPPKDARTNVTLSAGLSIPESPHSSNTSKKVKRIDSSDSDHEKDFTNIFHKLLKQKPSDDDTLIAYEKSNIPTSLEKSEDYRRDSTSKEKDKFNLGKLIMKEIMDLGGTKTGESKSISKNAIKDSEISAIEPNLASSAYASDFAGSEAPSAVSTDNVKKTKLKKKSKEQQKIDQPSILRHKGDDSTLNRFDGLTLNVGGSEDYPNIKPSLPPLSPQVFRELPQNNSNTLSTQENLTRPSNQDQKGSDISRFVKKLAKKKSESHVLKDTKHFDFPPTVSYEDAGTSSKIVDKVVEFRKFDKSHQTHPKTIENNLNIVPSQDMARTVSTNFDEDKKHHPFIMPIITDEDDEHLNKESPSKDTSIYDPLQDGKKKRGTDLTTKKIKTFFDNALANVREEFEGTKDHDSNSPTKKKVRHSASSGEEISNSRNVKRNESPQSKLGNVHLHEPKLGIKKKLKKKKSSAGTTDGELKKPHKKNESLGLKREKINRLISQFLQEQQSTEQPLDSSSMLDNNRIDDTVRHQSKSPIDDKAIKDVTAPSISQTDKFKALHKTLFKKLSKHLNFDEDGEDEFGGAATSSSTEDEGTKNVKKKNKGLKIIDGNNDKQLGYYSSPSLSGSDDQTDDEVDIVNPPPKHIQSNSNLFNINTQQPDNDEESFISESFNKLQKRQNNMSSKVPELIADSKKPSPHRQHKDKLEDINKFIEKLRALNLNKNRSYSSSGESKANLHKISSDNHLKTSKIKPNNLSKSIVTQSPDKNIRKDSLSAPSSEADLTNISKISRYT